MLDCNNSFFYIGRKRVIGYHEHRTDFRSAKVAGVPRGNDERLKQPLAGDRGATAAYLAAMIGDLAAIAHRHDFEPLAYLLDMARLEAEGTVQQLEP